MNMFDEARSLFGTMRMCRLTQAGLAEKLGVSQSYVANKLRLLGYSDAMQKRILDAGLTERHARAILRLKDESARAAVLEKTIENKLTVRQCELLVDDIFDEAIPSLISRVEGIDRIDKFKNLLKGSVINLRKYGINAREHIDLYGNKTYITIAIEEF